MNAVVVYILSGGSDEERKEKVIIIKITSLHLYNALRIEQLTHVFAFEMNARARVLFRLTPLFPP